ncbi:synaptic vesicle glycoprotein 2C-like [Diprion similis]|uniref:synaptic vesicle glycoprotein 2C-like n=1 Tax=Diprion similis TaxID=362088 RepID=UPI001EF94C7A|nr:synaptic vesicle glycoprotein 2C-like [Diprion similis]
MSDSYRVSEHPEGDIELKKVQDYSSGDHPRGLKSADEEADLERAIELTGLGWYHIGLIAICGALLIITVCETMGISFVLPAAQCELALTTAEKGYLSGTLFLGMIISAHLWGFFADIFGRKKILLITTIGTWAFSFMSSFSPNTNFYIVLRFVTGLFCGNQSTVYVYLSEFLPASKRGSIITWTCGFMAAAYLLMPGLAWVLIPLEVNWDLGFVVYTSWRVYLVAVGSLSLATSFLLPLFPESPKFLMWVGRKHEALDVLRLIYNRNSGNSNVEYPVKELKFDVHDTPGHVMTPVSSTLQGFVRIMWRQTIAILRPPYGWTTLLFCLLQFGIYGTSIGMYIWLPNLVNMMKSGTGSGATICDLVLANQANLTLNSTLESAECSSLIRSEVYMSTLVTGVLFVVSYGTLGGMVKILRKKTVLVSALFLSAIAGFGSYFARNEIIVALLISVTIILTGTCATVSNAIIVEVYPTNFRAMAVGLAYTFGRLGITLALNTIGVLIESYCDFTLIGLSCVTLICSLLCILLPK